MVTVLTVRAGPQTGVVGRDRVSFARSRLVGRCRGSQQPRR